MPLFICDRSHCVEQTPPGTASRCEGCELRCIRPSPVPWRPKEKIGEVGVYCHHATPGLVGQVGAPPLVHPRWFTPAGPTSERTLT